MQFSLSVSKTFSDGVNIDNHSGYAKADTGAVSYLAVSKTMLMICLNMTDGKKLFLDLLVILVYNLSSDNDSLSTQTSNHFICTYERSYKVS